ncbi:MAG TPA: glycosyl hydrolase [Thermoanaerobaculia bacterium]|nr:glycosyl hydrolase [Thermoanaerobaculia bacterium]
MRQTVVLGALLWLAAAAGAAQPDRLPPTAKPTMTEKKEEPKEETPADKDKKKAGKEEKKEPFSSATFKGLKLRGIGPATISGRIADLAVDPRHWATYYLAVASGGVWKTVNDGTTFEPIFDGEGSYSIGSVAVDPNDSLVVWAGTGENNSQRSVSYGDGVYKSADGGQHWTNVGLKSSEHLAKIVIDPRNSDTVYVAAQGPLWSAGGDRGLYKTTDGGKSWKKVLNVSDNTGVTDLALDPKNPDVLYAASYQRRRHVWTLIDGGPESAIYKSRDAGATWQKLSNGLPKEEMGRIGLALSPVDPDVIYATIEAARGASGFYRSTDAGSTWQKRSAALATSPQYYQKIYADPKVVDRVYLMDTLMKVTEDGGKTFHNVGEKSKHVDNHALWIDPADTNHLLDGCDGGVYESFDRGAIWSWKANLPLAQFYRVDVDYALPFYGVYGGAQDNSSLGGPSRTRNVNGIANSDWYFTNGGDGFVSRADPEDPNIVYAQSQYGGIVRYDRKSGEQVDIQPQPAAGEPPLRFNWDSPLAISPFSHTRLYMGANRLFRSDDRGDTWRPVSPDLTRQLDRNKLQVMGTVWSVDSVAKNASTSFYGNIVALSESPGKEGLIYLGTDDGLIQVTEDGGANWRKIDRFPGVPENTYVAGITTSRHDPNTVYASWDNHKMGDFKPYLLKSTDRGATWISIAGNLPQRGTVYTLAEDHVKGDLLFAGTEFGLYFTVDGGKKWIQLQGDLPTIAVRDLVIQRRENDLALATFGRGFYILDDYSPLRAVDAKALEQPALLFPVKKALMYYESYPLGGRKKAAFGESMFLAPNPPFGAVFTYYLKDELKSRKKARQEEEKKLQKESKPVYYPSWEELRAEEREKEPTVVWTVADEEGHVIRRGTGPVAAGFHRVSWDLLFPAANPTPTSERTDDNDFFDGGPTGPMVAPGTYRVSLAKVVDGVETALGQPQSFVVEPIGEVSLPAKDRAAALAFQQKAARLQRAALGAVKAAEAAESRIALIEKALQDTPRADPKLRDEALGLERRLRDLREKLTGDKVMASHNEPTAPSVIERMQRSLSWGTSAAATRTQEDAYSVASQSFAPLLEQLRQLVEVDLKRLEDQLESAGAPWTPGRVPRWQPE